MLINDLKVDNLTTDHARGMPFHKHLIFLVLFVTLQCRGTVTSTFVVVHMQFIARNEGSAEQFCMCSQFNALCLGFSKLLPACKLGSDFTISVFFCRAGTHEYNQSSNYYILQTGLTTVDG